MKLAYMLSAVAGALLLSNCAYVDVNNVRNMEPQGTDFTKALFTEYVALADFEVGEYDFDDASKYAARARAAGGGEVVQPYVPSEWDIGAEFLPDLESSRVRLLDALDGGGRDVAPVEAAKAQAMYDCWVEQQEEGHQADDIAHCRGEFEYNLGIVVAALKPAEEPVAEAAPAEEEAPMKFIIYFAFDSAVVADSAAGVIGEIASQAASANPSAISVAGHADRAGSDDYNLKLSKARADAVAALLSQDGVSADKLQVSEYGESMPLVQTDDGVPNPENRRVEIEFVQ